MFIWCIDYFPYPHGTPFLPSAWGVRVSLLWHCIWVTLLVMAFPFLELYTLHLSCILVLAHGISLLMVLGKWFEKDFLSIYWCIEILYWSLAFEITKCCQNFHWTIVSLFTLVWILAICGWASKDWFAWDMDLFFVC